MKHGNVWESTGQIKWARGGTTDLMSCSGCSVTRSLSPGNRWLEREPEPNKIEVEPDRITDVAWDLVVDGPRQNDYGHPKEDFLRTGRMWAAILGVDEVTPQQVALCMVALKVSRECNRPNKDGRTDMIGYALCLDRIEEGY